MRTADNISTFRFVVKNVAMQQRPARHLHAQAGVRHQRLRHAHAPIALRRRANVFHDPKGSWELSATCLHYIGGLLRHARGMCAITNPLVNSFKRLVPGYEAPTNIAWSEKNRSPLIRVPAPRGTATRVELRMPDPSCNPYLALAVMLRVRSRRDRHRGRSRAAGEQEHLQDEVSRAPSLRIDELPGNLSEALDLLEKDDLVRETLGEHIFTHFLEAKREEWDSYIRQVTDWERERYLKVY